MWRHSGWVRFDLEAGHAFGHSVWVRFDLEAGHAFGHIAASVDVVHTIAEVIAAGKNYRAQGKQK